MAAAAGIPAVAAARATERGGRKHSADARRVSGAPAARRSAAARVRTTPLGPGAAGRPAFTVQGSVNAPRPPLIEPRAEAAKDHRQEPAVPRQQPSERSVSWSPQPEEPASPPRAPRNELAPEEHDNNPLLRDEPLARPWRGAAPPPEPPPLPLAPEPPVDPLSQRRSPLRPPLAEPRAEVAGNYRQRAECTAPTHAGTLGDR